MERFVIFLYTYFIHLGGVNVEKHTIMIVEDEDGIREFTLKFLIKEGFNVVPAKNGEEALKLLKTIEPDLILLDIEMPGMDGFSVCKEIRKQLSVPIIFLTVRRDTMDKVKCFELGGDDYVTKPFDFQELHARINANIRRYYNTTQRQHNTLTFGPLEIHLDSYKCFLDGKEVELSTKEMELLLLLAQHPNQVWSQEQIYDHIWSLDATGNIDTVKVHISHLRRKLEVNQRKTQFIKTVRGFGYMFVT